jgi:hypothetical protein
MEKSRARLAWEARKQSETTSEPVVIKTTKPGFKEYLYAKDELNRVTEIYEATEENLKNFAYYHKIDLKESVVPNIVLGYSGFDKQGNVIYIGETQEEKQHLEVTLKFERLQYLKQLLADTDWKVIVNAELIQAELPLKYPNLHEERQAWRDEINALEG